MVKPDEDRILYLPSHVPPARISFHLDENIGQKIAGRLRDDGFDVTTTEEAGLRSKSDRTQMDYALLQQRVIVTRDHDFVQFHHEQNPHSGIVYWPHPRLTSSPQMIELLVRFLKQISRAPESELVMVAAHPRSLPLGTVLQVVVRRIDRAGAHVVLESGYRGLIEHNHLPRCGIAVNDLVEAVVVRYVKSRKRLLLSMRRNCTFARTMPARFQRQLRRDDHRIQREIQDATGAEIVGETPNKIRVFSDTLESLNEAAARLRDAFPWTCEAVVRVDRPAFRRWVLAEFAGVRRFGEQMQVRIDSDHLGRLLIWAVADSLVENALNTIATAVPEVEVYGFIRSFVEPLRQYGRPGRRVESFGSLGQPLTHAGVLPSSNSSGRLVQQRLKLIW
jgi:predicted nuclease of predicted toxin-antitoxin system